MDAINSTYKYLPNQWEILASTKTMATSSDISNCFIPPRDPVSYGWKLFLHLVYTIPAVIGIILNAIVIHVQVKGRAKSQMQFALINLSGSYIVMAFFSMPFTFTSVMNGKEWVFPDFLCRVSVSAQFFSASNTLFTLSAIAVERKFAVCHIRSNVSDWMRDHPGLMISISWIIAALYSFIYMWATNTHAIRIDHNNQTYVQCKGENVTGLKKHIIIACDTVLLYILPLLIIAWSSTSMTRDIIETAANARQRSSTEKPIRTVVIAAIAYGVCWSPIKLLQLAMQYTSWWDCLSEDGYYATLVAYFLFHWLAMMHIIINPLVYCFMCKRFMDNMKELWPYCYLFRNEPITGSVRMEIASTPRRSPRFTFDESPPEAVPPTTFSIMAYFNDPDITYIDDEL